MASWDTYFDNTRWSAGLHASWDGSKWVYGGVGENQGYITELGSWVESYAPKYIRVTFTGATGNVVTLNLSNGEATQLNQVGYASGAAAGPINLQGMDLSILRLLFTMDDTVNVTNIEFTEDEVAAEESVEETLEMTPAPSYTTPKASELIADAVGLAAALMLGGNSALIIAETLGASVLARFAEQFQESVEEALGAADAPSHIVRVFLDIAEAMGVSEAVSRAWEKVASETLSLQEEVIGGRRYYPDVADSLTMYEALVWGWLKSVAESMGLADASVWQLVLKIEEELDAAGETTPGWRGSETLEEVLNVWEAATFGARINTSLEETLNLAASVAGALHIFLAEELRVQAAGAGVGIFQHTAAETLQAADTTGTAWAKVVEETLSVTETHLLQWLIFLAVDESMGLADAASRAVVYAPEIQETLSASAAVTARHLMNMMIEENLGAVVELEVDGSIWECWVLNTNDYHPSVYSNYGYNSYCVHNNEAHGMKAAGIYRLDGSTDAGDVIHTGMVLAQHAMGTSKIKKFRQAFFGISGDAPTIKMENEDGAYKVYSIVNSKVTVDQNFSGRKWTLSLQDFDTLDFIELLPVKVWQ